MSDVRAQRPFNIFDLSGRASRLEFTIVLAAWLAVFLIYRGVDPRDLTIPIIVGVAASAPLILTGIRRLHDRDQSGWWMLLSFVPLIGVVFLVFLAAGSPDERVNRFGPPARLLPARA
ncbi:DUF805 domain-containing protein [Phenylobacterium sp.]|jgi:uncharacterized membrane protein YhaH (DUF805 family)|uniref:DUF805 domain-containing protein n=1 Tax=Phenylobacterium sp. TaxID=1871053 RepID=UPI002E367566|nr:DUF805 domain-containing protein [Phenylobacterium sp.]HEX2560422.1 DUF805 domain-containing protein [Phenylobacterium sp.]